MKRFRIDFYSGWACTDTLLRREYRTFASEADAKQWAMENRPNRTCGFAVNSVA